MPSNHLILCRPFLLLPSIFPIIRVFSNESALHIRWPNIGVSASASVLPINIQDWFPVGWTGWISLQSKDSFKSLLQHHSSKASILRLSAFFIVQLSHPHKTTGKTVSLTRWTFVGKVMSLLFMLSRLVIREGNGNPLQNSCLENPRNRGAWWAAVYGIAESDPTEAI